MRDFAERLDHHLRVIAVDLPDRAPRLTLVPPPGRRRDATPRPAPLARWRAMLTGATAAATAVAATTVVLTGSSAAGLPILATETSDASVASTSRLERAGVDFRQAHAFDTPDGPGWVVASADGQKICIAIPDSTSPGEYPTTCGPTARVEQAGMALEIVGDKTNDAAAINLVGLILPLGAEDIRLRTAGTVAPATVEAGVAVAALRGPGTFTYRLGERRHSRMFEGPFERSFFKCNGKHYPLPAPDPETGTTTLKQLREMCR